MNQQKITIILIHYNTPRYLRTCLDSIFEQTYENIEVIFIDNNSPGAILEGGSDGIDLLKKKYKKQIRDKKLKIVQNKKNPGYAGAANQGMKLAVGEGKSSKKPQQLPEYIVITNPDIIYTPDYFKKAVERIEKDPKIGAITGKVYKYDFEKAKFANTNAGRTKIIDTVGLFAYKNRRIIDEGQGMKDEGQFDEEKEVFGVSGACPLYRREALEDVKVMDEYWDDDFFMYKEDVDLAWRLRLYGWKALYCPDAIAYHGRGTGIHKRFSNMEVAKNRKHLSKFQKKYSFRNQLLMEAKNETWGTFFGDFRSILLKKFLTVGYITLREPYLWGSYLGYLKLLPRILKKRKIIMKNKRISGKEMGEWFEIF